MPLPDSVLALDPDVQRALASTLRPKFEAYFSFTGGLVRHVPRAEGDFVYPNESVISDLTVVWALFVELCEMLGNNGQGLAWLVVTDAYLRGELRRIQSEHPRGAFWHFPAGEVALADATEGPELWHVVRTLRNGFAHFNWRYDNLSATAYWTAQDWEVPGADVRFDIGNRGANNWTAYVADWARPRGARLYLRSGGGTTCAFS